eukprot:10599207-Lingulodinium_polyedra.AAC.1
MPDSGRWGNQRNSANIGGPGRSQRRGTLLSQLRRTRAYATPWRTQELDAIRRLCNCNSVHNKR